MIGLCIWKQKKLSIFSLRVGSTVYIPQLPCLTVNGVIYASFYSRQHHILIIVVIMPALYLQPPYPLPLHPTMNVLLSLIILPLLKYLLYHIILRLSIRLYVGKRSYLDT